MSTLRTLYSIYINPYYALLTIFVSVLVFTFAIWLPNISLIMTVLGGPTTIVHKATFLASLYLSIQTNFTAFSATYTILIAFLSGIQIALLTAYIFSMRTKRLVLVKIKSSGLGGLFAGMLGIGCAACGTFVLSALLAMFGANWLLAFLPLGGEEFGVAGIFLLLYSIYLLLIQLQKPKIC